MIFAFLRQGMSVELRSAVAEDKALLGSNLSAVDRPGLAGVETPRSFNG